MTISITVILLRNKLKLILFISNGNLLMTLLDLNPILVSDGIISAVMDFIEAFLCLKLKLQLKYLIASS